MAMAADDIVSLIKAALPDAIIEMTDLAGDNDHWKAVITSAAFVGKSRVAQHQMVYAALKGSMDGARGQLHALALETKTPDA
ncbi:MAG: BolA family transcriptional regulator [Litorimonas sp.]